MKKWVWLILLTLALLALGQWMGEILALHAAFNLMVFFFFAQTFVLFRIDAWVKGEWAVQASLVKIVIRLLASLTFILVLILTQTEKFTLASQFLGLYLIFMVFEIGIALTNLRRN